jgi:acetolactate synthase-1/2/3 large subunit
MGAKLARPDWLAVNLMGDAAFGMVGMDLETAVRNKIATLTVLMNNGCMGGYVKKQPIASERYAINRLSGNYSKVADGLGAYTERVERVDEVKPALQRAIAQTEMGRAALLEIMTAENPDLPGH